MNTNTLIGIVLALVIGFAGGWLLSPKQAGDEGESRRGGSMGPTPSTVAGNVPNGTWSKVGTGSGLAVDMLDEIQDLAIDALEAEDLTAAMFTNINDKLLKCAINENPFSGGDDQAHIDQLLSVKVDAEAGQWSQVLMKMTSHGH